MKGLKIEAYLVMHKDTPVYKAEMTLRGGKNISKPHVTVLDERLCPAPLKRGTSLEAWIKDRFAIAERVDIVKLRSLYLCDTLIDFAALTHAVSLTDVYWVKAETEPVEWKEVSPYRNKLNKQVSRYLMTGEIESTHPHDGVSPEYTTDGAFTKCWKRENNHICLLKCGSTGASNTGLEPYSEFYVAQLAATLGVYAHVPYTLHRNKGVIYSACPLFTSENRSLVSVADLIRQYAVICRSYSDVLLFLKEIGVPNVDETLRELLLLDCLTLNVDRHFGNIGVLYDSDTLKYVGLAPIFDNNKALLPYYATKDGLEKYLSKHNYYTAKSNILAYTGEDFIALGQQVATPNLRKKLSKLQNFEFQSYGSYNLPARRLKELSGLVREQATRILNN